MENELVHAENIVIEDTLVLLKQEGFSLQVFDEEGYQVSFNGDVTGKFLHTISKESIVSIWADKEEVHGDVLFLRGEQGASFFHDYSDSLEEILEEVFDLAENLLG